MIVKETIRQIGKVSTRGIYTDTHDQEHRVSFMDRLSKLSDDAIEVVMLVFKTPSDFVDDLSKSKIREYLYKKWAGRRGKPTKNGMLQNRVSSAFCEIKDTLNDF